MGVEVAGRQLAEGRGRTKKLAEQAAASAALEGIQKGELVVTRNEEEPT